MAEAARSLPRTQLPVALSVQARPCLVVGGGAIGSRKVETLLAFGAVVTVVSPEATPAVAARARDGSIRWLRDTFREEQLEGMALAVTAVGLEEVNAAVVAAARQRRIPVCDASDAGRSDFVFGALLEGPGERIAVFTDGLDPRHARLTRDRLRRQMETPDALLMGRLTAAATHELRNVLAIVKESAGLVADLTRLRGGTADVDGSRTLQAADRVEAQVARGAELLGALNRLAHGPERGREALPLGVHVQDAVILCRRLVERRRCTLVLESQDTQALVEATVVELTGLVAALVDAALAVAPEGSAIRLRVGVAEGAACLRCALEPAGGDPAFAVPLEGAEPWFHAVAARAEDAGSPGEIKVCFPVRTAASSASPAAAEASVARGSA